MSGVPLEQTTFCDILCPTAGTKEATLSRCLAIALHCLLLCAFCLARSDQASAAERVALVIGNSSYERLPRLGNPANDAGDLSQSLRRLGFNVTIVTDATFEKLRVALREFSSAAAGADLAVLYYAGHGIEVAGENWLIPVDGQLRNDGDVNTEAIDMRAAMLAVSEAKTLGLVILDACRNDPFAHIRRASATRSASRGLAPIEPSENVLVAYAARDGTTARDGTGRNSPFTAALLRHIETPGLELEFLFRNVRDDVWQATNGAQQPFLYGSLSKDEIYLAGSAGTATVATALPSETEAAEAAEIAWSFLRTTADVETLRRFTERFPDSNQAPLAKQRIAAIQVTSVSDAPPIGVILLASEEPTPLDEAEVKVSRPFRRTTPAVETAWNVVKDSKDANVIRRFADRFPNNSRRVAALAPVVQSDVTRPRTAVQDFRDRILVSRTAMLQAAEDYDVLQCFRVNDILAPECQNALHRYPLISRFTYDYRFRFALCQALGDACGGRRDMLVSGTNLQGLALFNPKNVDPAIAAVPTILTTNGLASPSTGLPASAGPAAAPNFGSSPLGNPGAPSGAGAGAPAPSSTASPALGGAPTNSGSVGYSLAPPPPPPPPGAHGKLKSLNFRSATHTASPRTLAGKSVLINSKVGTVRLLGGRLFKLPANSFGTVRHTPVATLPAGRSPSIKIKHIVPRLATPRLGITTGRLTAIQTSNIRINAPTVRALAVTPVVTPKIAIAPNVRVPAVQTPTIKVNTPTIKINTPTVRVNTTTIRVNTPSVKVPTITTPTIRVPTVRVP